MTKVLQVVDLVQLVELTLKAISSPQAANLLVTAALAQLEGSCYHFSQLSYGKTYACGMG